MIRFRDIKENLSYKVGNQGVEDMSDLPEGAIQLPIKSKGNSGDYSQYNIAWEHPNFVGQGVIVSSFVLDESFNSMIQNDIDKLSEVNKKRLEIILSHFRKGMYVYDDNDKEISKYSQNTSDKVRYKWDTQTHYLQDFQHRDTNVLPYSKTIDNKNRLTYMIHKPVKEGAKWVCHIELSRCHGHTYQQTEYSEE